MKAISLRHSRHLFVLASLALITDPSQAQQSKFANLNVAQNDSDNNSTSVTLSLAPGSSGGIAIRGGNRGDYDMNMAAGADRDVGVLITSVSQLSRDNTAQGDTIGRFYATSACDFTGTPSDWFIPVHSSPAGAEANINVSMAFFPYSQWIGGFARNISGTNGGELNQLFGSTGLALGTNLTTVTPNTNNGQFLLNINGFVLGSYTAPALASQNGILLVNHAKNEDNYALSRANANGTFNLYVKDNAANGSSYEQDPVAFVYLPTTAVGTRNLVAVGRVNGDASADIGGGSFTVTKGPTGVWYLAISGHTGETGTLIISPEGGGPTNGDNIVSYEWDGANNRWIIESRDLPNPDAGLQDMGATEDVFSFAFFQAPPTTYISATFTGAPGDPVADADLGTAGNQPAITGTSAFATVSDALTNVGSLAPLFLNGGTYPEVVDLGSEFLITVTGDDSAQNVVINSLAGLAGSSLAIRGSSSVTLGGDDTSTVMDGPVSGGSASSIVKNGTGTLTLNANNSPFAGSLTINGGGVIVDDLGLGGDLGAGLITVNNGGVFTFGTNGNADLPDSTDVVVNTGGRFELGQSEYYGTITLDGGEFRFFSTSRADVNNFAVAPTAGGTAYHARSGSFTTSFSSGGTGGVLEAASVQGRFVKSTDGTVTMGDGTNFSSTMPVEIREGTLAFSGTHSVNGIGPLILGTETTAGNMRAVLGVTTISRALTTSLGGSSVEALASGTLNLAGSISGDGPLAVSAAGTLDFTPSVSQVQLVDVALTGNSTIGKADLGTTELSANSPFSGQINVKGGVLTISGGIAGSVVVEDLGCLSGEGVIGGNLDLGLSLGGRLLIDAASTGTIRVEGAVNLIGASQVGLSGMPDGIGSLSIPVLEYGTLTGFNPAALQLENSGAFRSGSGVFTDDAASSRILMSIETKSLVWNGATGSWDLATSADWQGTGPELFYYWDAVTFDDTSANPSVTLSGKLVPGAFTVDSDQTNYTISGTFIDYISGTSGLLKRGSSLLVMDAPNTFTGGTLIEEGLVEIRNPDGVGFGPVAVGSVSTGSADTGFYLGGRRIQFARDVIVSGGTGSATLGSRDTITGSGDDNLFTSISLARDVIFDSNAEDRTDYRNITGSGNITVTGTGRSVFTTTPALFSGDVTISTTGAGNLQIGAGSGAGDRIPDTSAVTVDAGATLRLSASEETIASLFGAGTVSGYLPSGGAALLTVGSGNFSGIIDGLTAGNVVSIVKTGTGVLVLSGNNNYGGTTTVSGGTLVVGNGGAGGDLGYDIVTVAEGTTLEYNRTGAVTQDGRLDSSGTPGGATLVLGGDATTNLILAAGGGTFDGAILVNQGTLTLGVTNPLATGASAPSFTLAAGTTLTNGTTATHAHLGTLTLAGGATVTTSSGAASYNSENYQLNGDVTVTGGTSSAVITRHASRTNANSGIGLRGTRNFNVADVSGDSASDLIVSTELEPAVFNTGLDEGALIKKGAGTLQFAGGIAHSYSGATVVGDGTFVADGSIAGSLMVSSGATIAPGASAGSFGAGATAIEGTYACEIAGATSDVLNVNGDLQLGVTSSLNLLSIGGGFTKPEYIIATWTGTRTGTFTNFTGLPGDYTLDYDETNKRIRLVGPGHAYSAWETSQGIAGAGPLTDSDGDGIRNGIEFVIGGDPSGPGSASNALLPLVTREDGFLEFVFRRTDTSAGFSPGVEYSANLGGWNKAINGVDGVTVVEENDFYGEGIDRVTANIPDPSGTAHLFARLGVNIP